MKFRWHVFLPSGLCNVPSWGVMTNRVASIFAMYESGRNGSFPTLWDHIFWNRFLWSHLFWRAFFTTSGSSQGYRQRFWKWVVLRRPPNVVLRRGGGQRAANRGFEDGIYSVGSQILFLEEVVVWRLSTEELRMSCHMRILMCGFKRKWRPEGNQQR